MLLRRALSWALAVKDPDAFVTQVTILIPQSKLGPSSKARSSDFDAEEDEANTKVTVQIAKAPKLASI